MSVYQVEEYYVHISFESELSEDQLNFIEGHLSDENYSDYDWQDDNFTLVIDGVESESDGESLEIAIINLLTNH